MFCFHLFEKSWLFCSSYTLSSKIVSWETRLTENGIPPEPNLCWCSASLIPQIKGYIHHNLIVLPVNSSKARIVVFESRKAIPELCHSAAPNPKNYLAVLVLYGTQGSVRGLNRWKHK